MKKYSFIIAAALLAAVTSCSHKHDHEKEEAHSEHKEGDGHNHGNEKEDESHTGEIIFSKEQAKAADLEVQVVSKGMFNEVIRTSGKIQTAQGDEETIVATANGIVSFPGKAIVEGAPVSKGATIVTISAKNLVDGDPMAKAKIAYETALKEYRRAEGLVKDKIISAKEFEQIRMSYENARTAYQAQSANVTSTGIKVTTAIGGYIKSRMVSQGEYVAVGQPIATVSQNRRLQLRADVAESDYSHLRKITDANFITSYDNRLYKMNELNGRLVSFGKASDTSSFYIPVTFEFNNIGDIIPGAYVDVFLIGAPEENVISVPVSAITEEQGLYFVYLQTGAEVYRKREVTISHSDGARVKVLSGLRPGDKVVVKGAKQVKLAANSSVVPEGHSH